MCGFTYSDLMGLINMTTKHRIRIFILFFLGITSSICAAQNREPQDLHIKETVISAKLPKRLRTYVPFWGTPLPSRWTREDSLVFDNCVASIDTTRVFPNWICWNLDLGSVAEDKYKFRRFVKKGSAIPAEGLLKQVIDECYRWAWKKPYGNTNVVFGSVYAAQDSQEPSAGFVAVCKLPSGVQEQVEEMTAYELFCPFQEIDESNLYLLEPEFDHGDLSDTDPFD